MRAVFAACVLPGRNWAGREGRTTVLRLEPEYGAAGAASCTACSRVRIKALGRSIAPGAFTTDRTHFDFLRFGSAGSMPGGTAFGSVAPAGCEETGGVSEVPLPHPVRPSISTSGIAAVQRHRSMVQKLLQEKLGSPNQGKAAIEPRPILPSVRSGLPNTPSQYASAEIISLPFIELSPRQMLRSMASFANLTLPSHMRALTPPRW